MPQHLRSAWNRTLFRLATLLVIVALVGWLAGAFWPVLAVGALCVVAWQFLRLRAVLRRLTARARIKPAEGDGVWNELDRLLHRGQVEMRARKRRLLAMLRAYRAAAAALPDAVVVIDRNSQRVQWFNKAGTTLLGLRHPADLHAPVVDRLQPLPMAHWLSAGRNAEPMLAAASPVNPDLRLNLRLVLEARQLGLPMVVVLNMTDMARKQGIVVDTVVLARELGLPVVETVGVHAGGADGLLAALDAPTPTSSRESFSAAARFRARSSSLSPRVLEWEAMSHTNATKTTM